MTDYKVIFTGMSTAGPCPVAAIKRGEVTMPYDAPLLFSEVNADKLNWLMNGDGTWNTVMQKNM